MKLQKHTWKKTKVVTSALAKTWASGSKTPLRLAGTSQVYMSKIKATERLKILLNSSKTGWILLQVLIENAKSLGSADKDHCRVPNMKTFQKQSFIYWVQFISSSEIFQPEQIFYPCSITNAIFLLDTLLTIHYVVDTDEKRSRMRRVIDKMAATSLRLRSTSEKDLNKVLNE